MFSLPDCSSNASRGTTQQRPRRRKLAVGWLACVVALAATVPAVAAAGPYTIKNLTPVSGPSPFAAGCPGALFDGTNITGYELESMIAVNPANPRNIIATWKQDAGFLSTRSDLIASSLDGGRTWSRSTIPGLTACTGGTGDIGTDPWVSAGGDGTVYFSGLSGDLSSDPPPVAVVASNSRDGGRSWRVPVTVAPALPNNDTDAITGSPTLAGHAYAVWSNFDHQFIFPATNVLRFSRTTNGGASWSSSVVVDQPGPFAWDYSPRLLVLPNGTLLTVFARVDLELGFGAHYAARSLDEGRTWLPAVQIGPLPLLEFFDPETGEELPQPHYPSAAVAPDGTAYVAFEANSAARSGGIGVARSRDGGLTWTTLTLPGVSAYAFEPAIAVDSHSTVGVTWYDLRNDRPDDSALTADVWFAHSDDRGASWLQTHVAGPTNLGAVHLPNRVGEYQGLAALRGRGFAAIFTLAAPQAKDGPTDIFFARIGPGGKPCHDEDEGYC
jgi:hypothetical protein